MARKVVDAGNVTRTIVSMKVMDGGALRNILRHKVMDADGVTLRTVATYVSLLSVSAPDTGGGARSGLGSVNIVSSPTTATPAGGLGPYSYSWAHQSGDAMTISAPTSATTTFSASVAPDSFAEGVFRVTVTDSSGQTASADVSVLLETH